MTTGTRTAAVAFLAAVCVCLLAAACSKPSEESRIRALLDEAARRAEKRDVGALMELFLPEYADVEGRDKAGTARLIADYLKRYRGVVVHVLGVHAEAISGEIRADVVCEVALSHGAAEVLRKLIRVGSEYYRFRFELHKDGAGEWRFLRAEWGSIGLPDLFPDSLDILRKLFPDL